MSDYPPPPGTPPNDPDGSSSPPPPPPPPPGSGGPPPPPPPPPGPGGPPPDGGWGSPPPPPPPGAPGGYGAPPGGPSSYSVGNAFNYSFTKFKEHWAPLVLITLLLVVGVVVVQLIAQVIISAAVPDPELNLETGEVENLGGGFFGTAMILSLLFNAVSLVVQLVVQSGIIKASLALTRGQKVDFATAFNGINWGQVVLAALIIGVMSFVGLILCILPGILVIFFTSYTLYFVLDRNLGAVDGIKASFNMVKDNFGQLILFFLASIAAYIVGACLCGVGLLAAIPIVIIAQAYTFRMLNGDPVTV